MAISDDKLEQLETEHRKVLHLRSEDEEAVFRRPTKLEFDRFQVEFIDEKTRPRALETLVVTCCVWPDREAFASMLEEWPGLASSFGNELLEFARVGKAEVVKKPLPRFGRPV